jgi:2-methylcitrate dehydratase PrpD
MAGVSAALLARGGLTGAPALTVESPDVAHIWSDLGTRWRISEQYFKPYPTCYWAQPAIAGALALQQAHDLPPDAVARIRVLTFHEATRLACRHPQTTEEAQYSLPFPVAAALVHGRLGLAELSGPALHDARVLRLADRVELVHDPILSARFPAERIARVHIETAAGALLDSGDVRAKWDGPTPPTDAELRQKFRWLARSSLSDARATALEEMVWNCADLPDVADLVDLLSCSMDR